jgi:hypothetical protein
LVEFLSTILNIRIDVEEVYENRPKVAALLRKNGGKHDSELAGSITGNIWKAAKTGNMEELTRLVEDESLINRHDDKGISPLSWAAMTGQKEAASLLINKEANINVKNGDGSTPLHGASFLGQLEMVALLIENRADVNAKNLAGDTPLGGVAMDWSEEIQGITQFIGSILEIKIDIEQVKTIRPEIVALLRKHGGKTGAELR